MGSGNKRGHGERGSEGKTSMEMRTQDWVEDLLSSPSKRGKDVDKKTSFDGPDKTSGI